MLAYSMGRKRPRRRETADVLRQLASGRVSGTALSEILRQLKSHRGRIEDLPTSRSAIDSAVLDAFDSISVTVSLQLDDGSELPWEFINPVVLLSETVRRLPLVVAAYQRAMVEHPPAPEKPWDLVVG